MNSLVQSNYSLKNSSSLSSTMVCPKIYCKNQNQVSNPNQKKYLNMLIFASQYNHLDTIKCLSELNVDFNQKDKSGSSPLMYAAQKGYFSLVQYLIENGARINESNTSGLTALMYACLYGHISVVSLLIARGALVNQMDHEGSTALFYAVSSKCLEIVQYLIEHGADPSIVNHNNATAFKLAEDKHYDGITYYLLRQTLISKRKESLYATNSSGKSNSLEKNNGEGVEDNNCNAIQIKNHERNNIISNHKKMSDKSAHKKNSKAALHREGFNVFDKKLNSKKSMKSLRVINFEREDKKEVEKKCQGLLAVQEKSFSSSDARDTSSIKYNISSIIDDYRIRDNAHTPKKYYISKCATTTTTGNNHNYNNSKILVYMNEEHSDRQDFYVANATGEYFYDSNESDFEGIKKRFQTSSLESKNEKIHQFFSNIIFNIKSLNK